MTLEELAALPDRIAAIESELQALKAAGLAGASKSVFTVREAAEYVVTSTQTVYDWIRCGRLPAFKLSHDGKTYRIYKRDLDSLITTLKDGANDDVCAH